MPGRCDDEGPPVTAGRVMLAAAMLAAVLASLAALIRAGPSN